MQRIAAIKITPETLKYIINVALPRDDVSAFAHALLTSAYNGENWYFVSGNVNAPSEIRYDKQIITEDVLKTSYDYKRLPADPYWIEVTPK